jgi:hypothetical protein
MSRTVWAIRRVLEEYAVARLRLLKTEEDGIRGECPEDDFYAARRSEDERWRALVEAVNGALGRSRPPAVDRNRKPADPVL